MLVITDNNIVNNALVILSAAGFALAIFPVHIHNYVYVNTSERYASLNVSVYRYFKLLNANTIKNSIDRMQINGKDKKVDLGFIKSKSLKIFNNICFLKIVQLADFGITKDKGVYIALFQRTFTNVAYSFIEGNGGRTKLKNYTILNREHDDVFYYAKIVSVINFVVIIKILFMLIMEKIHEQT